MTNRKQYTASFKFKVALETHPINAPSDSAVPERERLQVYSQLDAKRLASQHQIAWTFNETENIFTCIYKNYNDGLTIYTPQQLLNKIMDKDA